MTAPLFKGVITALITPLRDGKVDEAAFIALVERQIAGRRPRPGARWAPPARARPCIHDEHQRVVELCVETRRRAACRVIAGAGSKATDKAIELVRHAKAVGADARPGRHALLQPAQPGRAVRSISRPIDEAVQLPVLLYNVPGRTGVDIWPTRRWRGWRPMPNIVGIKDATGDMAPDQPHARGAGQDWIRPDVGRRPQLRWATWPTAATG